VIGEAAPAKAGRDPDGQLGALALPVKREHADPPAAVVAARLHQRQADPLTGETQSL